MKTNLTWQHYYCEVTGPTHASLFSMIHPADLSRVHSFFQQQLNGLERSFSLNLRILKKDGTFGWVKWSCTADYSNHTLYGVTRKLDEHKKDAGEFQRIVNSIPSLIGQWNKDLINTFSNFGYAQFLNRRPEQVHGRHIREVLGEELFLKQWPHIEKVLSGEPQTFERELGQPDGSVMHTLVKYLPDICENEVVGFLVVATDISELKKLERERCDAQAKLIDSAKMSLLGEMASGIAHEINNPLSIIYGKSGLLKRKVESDLAPKEILLAEITKIESMADRISRIIKGLHHFSRNSEKDVIETCLLTDLIHETLELCAEKFHHHSVKLEVNCPDVLTLDCRSTQLSQVLMNLLSNAFDAVEKLQEKWIRIEAHGSPEEVILKVFDSGSGIPAFLQEKIMQPFFTTKGIGRGTGLGLSISKGLIEKHQGQLYIDANCKNTCFIIRLPNKINDFNKRNSA